MTAKAARYSALRSIRRDIKRQAKAGLFRVFFWHKLSDEIIKELESDGYEVRQYYFKESFWFLVDEIPGEVSWK